MQGVQKIGGVLMCIVAVYFGMVFVSEMAPEIGNITYGGASGIGATFFDLLKEWLPVISIVGLLFFAITYLWKTSKT